VTKAPLVRTIIHRPAFYRRRHVLVRLAVLAAITALAAVLWFADLKFLSYTVGLSWIFGIGYLITPLIVAWKVWRKGPERYLREDGPWMQDKVRRTVALSAYLNALTDKPSEGVDVEIEMNARPTPLSAALRLFATLPSLLVMGVVYVLAFLPWTVMIALIMLRRNYPQGFFDWLAAMARWQSRLLAYHASLIDEYPPLTLHVNTRVPAAEQA
jgi:hypothetical protein